MSAPTDGMTAVKELHFILMCKRAYRTYTDEELYFRYRSRSSVGLFRGFAPFCCALMVLFLLLTCLSLGQTRNFASTQMDRDLTEVDVPRLQALYASGKYTVVQVTQWYLDRIARYDGVYKALLDVDSSGALAAAATEDAAKKQGGNAFKSGVLWGVPVVIKANTSVQGLVTSNGWSGYLVRGHELKAPKDATIVAKLKAAGAVILGHTNMPDFANSDTTFSSAGGRTGNAYNWRFSPGGSSGGTATSVAANFAVLGTGTDTSNSIRLPSGASSLVGVLPTRGLVSINGIHPLDWLLDNAGPIARNVTDAALALTVMAGEDAKDFRTDSSLDKAQPGPYTRYLKKDALKGKRFGVPAFIVGEGIPDGNSLRPEARAAFMKALEGLRAAGATVVFDTAILPNSFFKLTEDINSRPYIRQGVERFLQDFGPQEYHSTAEYARAVGSPFPDFLVGFGQQSLEKDARADANFWAPQRLALTAYEGALTRFRLDGFVYPALQMAPNDETNGRPSNGPHTRTAWVNTIGVPAVVVPGGFYENGLPFGLEFSGRQWKDGDLLGWAFAYEQATRHRKPPALVDRAP
jgi:Asp-tRNA(Asn)/Glu-tRNA(Gln) amidotransferase A subunit family amidase